MIPMSIWKDIYAKEKALIWTGLFGIVLGLIGIVFYLVNGNEIPPEGKWTKAITFDLAIGIFSLTLAVLLPYMQVSDKQRNWFVYPLIVTFWIAYAIETIQNARGYDPRFTETGTVFDSLIGLFLGIDSVFIVISLVYFLVLVLKQKTSVYSLIVLATRYSAFSILIAIFAGIWMIAYAQMIMNAGASKPEMPNQMMLHFIGFHGLQAIPIIGWFATYTTNLSAKKARMQIHIGGIAWLVVGISLFVQTAVGYHTFDFTGYLVIAIIAFIIWFYQVIISFIQIFNQLKQKGSSIEHV
jgi:hypothetical protein